MFLSKYIILLVWFLLIAWCADAHAVDSAMVRQRANEILSDPAFQKKLFLSPTQQSDVHAWGNKKLAIKKQPGVTGGLSFFTLLAWLGVGLALVLVATWIAASIHRKKLMDRTTNESESEQELSDEQRGLAQTKQLAALGKFLEAIHGIFLITVSRLADKRGRTISSWMTSRELTNILPTGKGERETFSRLVRTVETGLFGGRQLGRSDYEQCMHDYEILVGD